MRLQPRNRVHTGIGQPIKIHFQVDLFRLIYHLMQDVSTGDLRKLIGVIMIVKLETILRRLLRNLLHFSNEALPALQSFKSGIRDNNPRISDLLFESQRFLEIILQNLER
ncbi:hypothetical protein D3C74_389480 [compost metagenome]